MPGIAGIVSSLPSDRAQRDLAQMLRCMEHEPFYHSGIYVNQQLGLYVGWVCHEQSFADCMPVFNEKRDRVLIFAGENFADFATITTPQRARSRVCQFQCELFNTPL